MNYDINSKEVELSQKKKLRYYAYLGILIFTFSIIGATYGYLTATESNDNSISGNMATVSLGLNVQKVTNVDNEVGLIPMSNNMVEMALKSSKGICIDDNGNAVCQVYKITVNNEGSNNIFVDGYINLTGGSGSPVDYTEYKNTENKTTMRWAQAFCSTEDNDGMVTSCTTAGKSTSRTDTNVTFASLGGESVKDDYLNLAEIKHLESDVISSATIKSNSYNVIDKNYIRVSDHNSGSNVYNSGSDVTSALVYNQYLSANDNDASNNTGTSSSIYTDSQVYYFVLWLSETGTNQTAGAAGAATVTDDFFGGSVTFLTTRGSSTAKFGNYASGIDESAANYVTKLYNDGNTLTTVNIGGSTSNPSVTLNARQGIMLDNNGEYRYYGTNPNNYVKFNNELWRIISVSNVKSDTNDTKGSLRIKIIKDSSIGNYSWDSSDSTVNTGYGVNDWSQADLMTELNDLYYNQKTGTCYNGQNNASVACDFTTIGLSTTAKTQISPAVYNLGGSSIGYPYNAYNGERSTNVYTGRPTSWEGIVGLMYPSDYMYATDLSLCKEKGYTEEGDDYRNAECRDNNWLYVSNNWQWTLSHYTGYASGAFYVRSAGDVYRSSVHDAGLVRPVVYLKSDISIVSGAGTKNVPYILG